MVWANQAIAPVCGASGDQVKSVGSLAVGASKTLTFTGLAAWSAGTKTFRAFVDSACATPESNEGNNQHTKSYTVPNQPDFIITGMTLTPASPAANNTITATVVVKNQGTATGDAKQWTVWANQATTPGCGASGSGAFVVGSLAPGASLGVGFNGLAAGSAGTKTFRAFVDSACATPESNEGNNQTMKDYTVNGCSPQLLPECFSLPPPYM